jgi:hypothetical protein
MRWWDYVEAVIDQIDKRLPRVLTKIIRIAGRLTYFALAIRGLWATLH